ncbi:MAG: FHA domain-containing protein [Salinibacter sp.]
MAGAKVMRGGTLRMNSMRFGHGNGNFAGVEADPSPQLDTRRDVVAGQARLSGGALAPGTSRYDREPVGVRRAVFPGVSWASTVDAKRGRGQQRSRNRSSVRVRNENCCDPGAEPTPRYRRAFPREPRSATGRRRSAGFGTRGTRTLPDQKVRSEHAEIRGDGGADCLVDRDSTGRTHVNGRRLRGRVSPAFRTLVGAASPTRTPTRRTPTSTPTRLESTPGNLPPRRTGSPRPTSLHRRRSGTSPWRPPAACEKSTVGDRARRPPPDRGRILKSLPEPSPPPRSFIPCRVSSRSNAPRPMRLTPIPEGPRYPRRS